MAGLIPAIPMLWSTALQAIEITGTRPVMTEGAEGVQALTEIESATLPQPLGHPHIILWERHASKG
jgi:hypothetical protein